jgi:hypothetical protein
MEPADIPEDIRQAARTAVERGYDEGLLVAVEKALLAERMKERARCAKALAEADRHAEKLEALLDPHIKWDDA